MFKRTTFNRYINPALRCIPKWMWNEFSCFCASFTARTIGSPVRFCFKQFRLEEYPTNRLPPVLLQKFLVFCYPSDLPDRRQQIDLDKKLYWGQSSTLMVFDRSDTMVGCVQIVFGDEEHKLPVEYAQVAAHDNTARQCNIREFIPSGTISEIYRCRRSFELGRMEAIQVLMMLFKAVWAKTIQCGTAWSCISFDPEKTDLRHLYLNKLAFSDPGCALTFGNDPKQWSLLIKDWSYHETQYAAESTTHFYMQTWGRMGLRQKHWKLSEKEFSRTQTRSNAGSGNVLITETVRASSDHRRRKGRMVH